MDHDKEHDERAAATGSSDTSATPPGGRPTLSPAPSSPQTHAGSPFDGELPDAAVDRALRLARLSVDAAGHAAAAGEFTRLLGAFAKLREVDVEGIEPLYSPSACSDVFREDRSAPSLEREELLRNAPAPRDGFFAVPKTIGGDA